ncbi:MAG: hypothetical protein R2932_42335 [Caldilineaceae bacterium]
MIATNVPYRFGKRNELVVLDADTFAEVKRTRLLDNTLFFKFSQDPLGRIWIGYAGAIENPTKRVDVFARDGSLIHSMDLCTWPNATITFADGAAFVPCYLNGFHARVAVIDLATFAVETTIEFEAEPHFSLMAAAANQQSVIVIGSSDTHATLFIINPKIKTTQQKISFSGGDTFTILVHNERFFLLNRASSFRPENPVDLHIIDLDATPKITEHQLAVRDPLLGLIDGEYLWAYHQPGATNDNGSRAISRTNLVTDESQSWPLPDYWRAGDMMIRNGRIVLTRRHSLDPSETAGLYEFDPATGKLTQILALPGAHLLLLGVAEQ